jgi:hypothetical protein
MEKPNKSARPIAWAGLKVARLTPPLRSSTPCDTPCDTERIQLFRP